MTITCLRGKLPIALFLAGAGLLTTAPAVFSGGQAPAMPAAKIQIKVLIDGKEVDLDEIRAALQITRRRTPENPAPKSAWQIQPQLLPGQSSPQAKPAAPATNPIVTNIRLAADPRIEELVKQAEAIKPGSGAEVRKALGGARLEMKPIGLAPGQSPYKAPENPSPQIRQTAPAQQPKPDRIVIIISDADGKVRQLNSAEAEIFLKKGGIAPSAPKPADADALRKAQEELKRALESLQKQQSSTKPNPDRKIELEFMLRTQGTEVKDRLEKKPATEASRIVVVPANPAPPQDDLRREVQRLRDELTDLRKRLDGLKK